MAANTGRGFQHLSAMAFARLCSKKVNNNASSLSLTRSRWFKLLRRCRFHGLSRGRHCGAAYGHETTFVVSPAPYSFLPWSTWSIKLNTTWIHDRVCQHACGWFCISSSQANNGYQRLPLDAQCRGTRILAEMQRSRSTVAGQTP